MTTEQSQVPSTNPDEYEDLDDPYSLTTDEIEASVEADSDVESVSYQGTDFDAEGLVRRLNRGDVLIPSFGGEDTDLEISSFQRKFVWTKPQMDRFIESLLLGFPIPGIMLVQQTDKRYLVLDGQQRLRTLQAFFNGILRDKVFYLENVADEFKGLSYEKLSPSHRRTLENTFIQATIVKTADTPKAQEAIYQIFERLNSGGTQLTPHEIRIALHPGEFVDFLADLNTNSHWRAIYGSVSPRMRDHEVLLRVFALYVSSEEYFRPLKRFLNDFLRRHRDMETLDKDFLGQVFRDAVEVLNEGGIRGHVRPRRQRLNLATFDAVMVAAMRRVSSGRPLQVEEVAKIMGNLESDSAFVSATSFQPDTEENVRQRLRIATAAFSG